MLLRKTITLALLALVTFTSHLMASGSHSHGGSHGNKDSNHKVVTKGTQKVCPIARKPLILTSLLNTKVKKSISAALAATKNS